MTDISPIMIGSPETGLYKRDLRPLSISDRSLSGPAIWASFRKLDPRTLVKKPVVCLPRSARPQLQSGWARPR